MFAMLFVCAAAGLFAQLTLRGSMETGVVVFFPDPGEEDYKPTISMWGAREGVVSRATLLGSAANEDKTAGVNFEIRGEAPYSANTSSLYFQTARAWIKLWDKKLTVTGGKLDDNGVLRSYGGVDEDNMARNDLGFHLRVEAIPNLTFGATVMPGTTGQRNYTNTLGMGNYRFAARYLVPKTLGLLTMFFDNAQTDTYQHDRLHSISAVDVLALQPFGFATLRADVGLYDIQDRDYFNLKAGQIIVYRLGKLELGGRFRQSFLLGEKNGETGYSPEYLFRLYGTYALGTGAVRPRLELGYLVGGFRGNPVVSVPNMRSDGYEAMNSRRTVVDPTMTNESDRVRGFKQDSAYMAVLPQCEFRVGNGSLILGGGPLFDLSAGNESYNYMAFSNLRVTF
jgi:hypothetical protein